MRRTRSLLLAVSVGVALIVSACGVTANTTAATVGGRDVPVDDVTALVDDPAFATGVGTGNESTEAGDDARSVLTFLIERAAWLSELDRWGLEITDSDRAAAASQLDQQLASAGMSKLKARTRELLLDYGAAQTVLGKRFAQLDPEDEGDLRRLYASSKLQFQQVCLTVVQVPATGIRAAQDRIDDGMSVDELVDAVKGSELVADPSQGCYAEVGLAGELRADLRLAPVGVTRGVVLTDDGAGGVTAYAYRLESRRTQTFSDAREDLAAAAEGLAQQGPADWVQLIALGAQVNPRYGQDVVRTSSGFTVLAPQRPEQPPGQRITDAIAAAKAAAAATAAQAGSADGTASADGTTADGTASTEGTTADGAASADAATSGG